MFNILHEPWATIKPWTSELRCYFIYRISLAIDLRLEWDYRKSPRSKRWLPHGTVFLNRLTKIIQFFSLQQFTSESLNCFNTEFSLEFPVPEGCLQSHCHPLLLFSYLLSLPSFSPILLHSQTLPGNMPLYQNLPIHPHWGGTSYKSLESS